MKHHQYNTDFPFIQDPVTFNKFTNKDILQYCLGATLYMPGTKNILDKILQKQFSDITSLVMCFEDAIQVQDVAKAEKNVINHLEAIAEAVNRNLLNIDDVPLIFIRVRDLEQFYDFSNRLTIKQVAVLTGFVFPKFYSYNADKYLQQIHTLRERHGCMLYAMPILEGKAIAFKETRIEELLLLKQVLEPYKKHILNIRVGGTDFSAFFGVRRGINYSIYDIMTVRDCIADILNFFTRAESDYIVSAPVWEYFLAYKKDDIKNILQKDIHKSLMNRTPILNEAIDGLLREVIIDKANGFVGKTIIHPSHAKFVNAMQTVTKEEYDDAVQILDTDGGVVKSAKSNKMNEINPHKSWAKKTILRAKAYGVVDNEISFLQLILG